MNKIMVLISNNLKCNNSSNTKYRIIIGSSNSISAYIHKRVQSVDSQISEHQSSQQHYSQDPEARHNPSAHWQING